jgi:hypothetical protein
LVIGHWSLVIGYWLLVIGYWLLEIEKRDLKTPVGEASAPALTPELLGH